MSTQVNLLFIIKVALFLGLASEFTAFKLGSNNVSTQFEHFKIGYGKVYKDEAEHDKRFENFKKNVNLINQHNQLYLAGKSSHYLGINELADMTREEIVDTFYGFNKSQGFGITLDNKSLGFGIRLGRRYKGNTDNLPREVDWRVEGYVTPVQDQGKCRSCWAFSAAGAMEGAHYRATQKLVSLSVQNLVDCDLKSSGCNGGYPDNAFKYVINNNGIDTASSYPYEARTSYCRYKSSNVGATICDYKKIKSGSEIQLQAAIAHEGLISVGVDAGGALFHFYKGGIFDNPGCSSTELNHAMLVVGYGSNNGQDYYIVKNSMGTNWGIGGYILMSRNKNNQCGIATLASFPIAKNGKKCCFGCLG